jgi:DNA-binding MarR family transcriptional regulator
MTTPQPPFGRTLAFAEQTLSEVLFRHLAERQTAPATWYALQLVSTRGPRLPREDLIAALALSRALTQDAIGDLLPRLAADGLIQGDAEIDLTPEGRALHDDLSEYVTGATTRFLSQFDAADIATTLRTLEAVTAQAKKDLATT